MPEQLYLYTMNALIKELTWRGMIQDIMPGTEEQLNKEVTTGYIGFDPTADSLHIGSLVPIILLVHLQKAGHKPVALVGGATGMVGDPSGKSEERSMLNETTLQKNQNGVAAQLARFIDFNGNEANSAILVNNYDWFKNISILDFLRDTGKHITVNYMMAKDSVKKRLEGQSGISFTEFSYQLIQGHDFFHLSENYGCKLQMGGSDQWGNMVTGTELIRRKNGKDAFAFTCPLIKKSDGGKFGKSEQGNIWLSAERTTPYQFYQFWLNASDEDAAQWIKIFTFLTEDGIEAIIELHQKNASERLLQKTLAEEVTRFVHGEEALQSAMATTEKLFANANADIGSLSETDLENIEGVISKAMSADMLKEGQDLTSLLAAAEICSSKGEARKLIANGGISLNRDKITDPTFAITNENLLHGKYILVQKGKKNYFLLQYA